MRRCHWLQPANRLGRRVARMSQSSLLRLGRLLAWMAQPLLRRRRRIAARNIALCFPQLDARAQRALLRRTMRATVTGRAQEVSPILVPGVRQTVEGPVEEFKVDQ